MGPLCLDAIPLNFSKRDKLRKAKPRHRKRIAKRFWASVPARNSNYMVYYSEKYLNLRLPGACEHAMRAWQRPVKPEAGNLLRFFNGHGVGA